MSDSTDSKYAIKERERRAIDSEIILLHESIRTLKIQRNSLAPISNLPADILTSIWMFVLLDRRHPDSCDMIRITHICQYWRVLSLNSPLLWTCYEFSQFHHSKKGHIAPHIISRSKSAPIFVYIRLGDDDLDSVTADFLKSYIHRIQELEINASNSQPFTFALKLSAPLLQDARFYYEGTHVEEDLYWVKPHLFNFLSGRTPRLQRLQLLVMPVDWSWPALSQVTELVIYASGPSTSSLLSLSVLRTMPQIEVFDLSQPLPKCPVSYDGKVDDKDLIHLPLLRRLRLGRVGSFRDCAFLLNHLRLTPHTKVWIEIQSEPGEEPSMASMFPWFGDQLRVVWMSAARIRFELGQNATLLMHFSLLTDFTKQMIIALESFSRASELASVEFMMDDHFNIRGAGWMAIFSHLRNVQRLALNLTSRDSGLALVRALVTENSGEAENSGMPLPNLQHLTVKYWSDDREGCERVRNMLNSRNEVIGKPLDVDMEAIDAEKRPKASPARRYFESSRS